MRWFLEAVKILMIFKIPSNLILYCARRNRPRAGVLIFTLFSLEVHSSCSFDITDIQINQREDTCFNFMFYLLIFIVQDLRYCGCRCRRAAPLRVSSFIPFHFVPYRPFPSCRVRFRRVPSRPVASRLVPCVRPVTTSTNTTRYSFNSLTNMPELT